MIIGGGFFVCLGFIILARPDWYVKFRNSYWGTRQDLVIPGTERVHGYMLSTAGLCIIVLTVLSTIL